MSDPRATAPSDGDPNSPRIPVRIEQTLAAIAIASIGLITLANVLTRYLIDYSLAFTEEYSVALMVVMTFLGSAGAVAQDRHIRITYVLEKFRGARRRMLETTGMLVVALAFLALVVLGSRMVWDQYRFGETSSGLGMPEWIYSIWLPVLSLLVVARALGRAVRCWRTGRP